MQTNLRWSAILAGAVFGIALLVTLHPLLSRNGIVWLLASCATLFAAAYLAGRVAGGSGALHGLVIWALVTIATNLPAVTLTAHSDMLLARADSPDGVQMQLRQLIADPSSVDRASLIRAVAAQAGIPEDQAQARVEQFEAQARGGALWRLATLLLGLGAAVIGGARAVRA
jgi:hypothetical protein